MSELTSDDSYPLRNAQMDADKRALEARKSQQELERLVLEMEHKYGLIAYGRSRRRRWSRPSSQQLPPNSFARFRGVEGK